MMIANRTTVKYTESHEGEVGHGAVPPGNLDYCGLFVSAVGDVDLLGAAGDLIYGPHEQVRHERDGDEAKL